MNLSEEALLIAMMYDKLTPEQQKQVERIVDAEVEASNYRKLVSPVLTDYYNNSIEKL